MSAEREKVFGSQISRQDLMLAVNCKQKICTTSIFVADIAYHYHIICWQVGDHSSRRLADISRCFGDNIKHLYLQIVASWIKTIIFPNPNQVVYVPQPNLSISKALWQETNTLMLVGITVIQSNSYCEGQTGAVKTPPSNTTGNPEGGGGAVLKNRLCHLHICQVRLL